MIEFIAGHVYSFAAGFALGALVCVCGVLSRGWISEDFRSGRER